MLSKIPPFLITRRLSKNVLKRVQRFSHEPPQVVTKEIGDKALIILNRPSTLNTMTVRSLKDLLEALKTQEKSKSLVIIKSAGGKAFSAGGNLKILAEAGEKRDEEVLEDTVMLLNANIYLINRYKIPTVVLMDGITMGGGAGITAFSKYKIATERTVFAMPEVKLGFHPNGSATYFFNHTTGKLGYYLALTGSNLTGSDVTKAGFATHYCKSGNLKILEEELIKNTNNSNIKKIIEDVCEKDIPELSLTPNLATIDKCFSEPSVEKILLKLEKDGSDWAKETLRTLNKYAPTALKVILKQLHRGKTMNLTDLLVMESNLTFNFYYYPDVVEGTRVVLTDKNDTPKWNPSRLEDVTEEAVENYFKPHREEKQRKLFEELNY